MKAEINESKNFGEAIDKMQEGLESVIELYNAVEEDTPIINLDKEVMENLEKAKRIFGEEYVSKKINTILREVLTWLDLDSYEVEEEE